jgi:hypothetical protein
VEDYNRIIESLSVRFIKARNINIISPVTIENNYDIENSLLLVGSGTLRFGKGKEKCSDGEVFFLPGGRQVSISYGSGEFTRLSKDNFLNNKEKYFINKKAFHNFYNFLLSSKYNCSYSKAIFLTENLSIFNNF